MDTVRVRRVAPPEREELHRMKRQRTNQVNSSHARMILLSSGGVRNREIAERVDYVDALSFLLRGPITSVPQAAYRWVLDNPDVSLVLSGASNVSQLTEVTAVSDFEGYSEDELRHTDEIHTRDFQAA